tara:strand:- start:2019 stop:2714 length:696 start_codon:yes stop_codon:yes gene_type:complete
MSNKIAWIAVLVAMFGGLGYLMSINEEKVTSNIISDVEALTKKFPTGDEITFYPQPNISPQEIPMQENNVVPIVEKTKIVNGTEVIVQEPVPTTELEQVDPQSQVFVGSSDLAYARNMDSIQTGTNDQIQLGNIVNIVGSIKLLDINGEEIPAPHKYSIDVDCDFRDFCNLITMTNRGETDTSGHFSYKWTTTQNDTIGEYVATITAQSDIKDPFGRPYLLKHEYRFWLIE